MGRTVVLACLPWVVLLAGLVVCLWLLVRLNRGRLDLRRLGSLHTDQLGSAQTLSFVLTLPLFVTIVLFIIQVSQVTIGTIVVHYAAFAAARSAIVWIPARLGMEPENCIGFGHRVDPPDQDPPSWEEPTDGGLTFVVDFVADSDNLKFQKIRAAAVMGLSSICPSRNLGLTEASRMSDEATTMSDAYGSMAPDSAGIGAVPRRMANKLAYADLATVVELRFYHRNRDAPHWPPPPAFYMYNGPEVPYFFANELDWQDDITVTVHHHMALLPGVGRLWGAFLRQWDDKEDELSEQIKKETGVHTYRLTATATLGNEGEKSVIPYVYYVY